MNSFQGFFEDRLPDRCKFCSSLKDECVSDTDYLHAVNVWTMFEMKTIGNYHETYLKTDVLLLAVFQKFIRASLKWITMD